MSGATRHVSSGRDSRAVRQGVVAALFLCGLILLPGLWAFGQVCPTIVVIIPEECIIRRVPQRVVDPASETAIIQHFLEYGFHVVDQNQVRAIRYTELVQEAIEGEQPAIQQLSDRFAADILVLGEAFSEVEVTRLPGQPTLQEGRARVELRAIQASTGRILDARAIHTGGVDFMENLACKRSLQRSGDKVACDLAKGIAKFLPPGCFLGCEAIPSQFGVTPFQNRSDCWERGWDMGQGLATMVETELSKRRLPVVSSLSADKVISGTISDCNAVMTPFLPIPILGMLFRVGILEMTVDLRLLDLATSEIRAEDIRASVSGIEILGIRFGLSLRDLSRAAARQIADRVSWLGR